MESTFFYNAPFYNAPFTYENVCRELHKFWMINIIKHKNKKIWLTINVNIASNTTFTLIRNLPFNTSDYNDVLIVLEDHLKLNLLKSKADILNCITFYYHIDNREDNLKYTKIKNIYVFLLALFALAMIFIYFLNYLVFDESLYIVETPLEVINEKPNKCVFSIFSDLFKLSNSSYEYYPSQFLPSNLKYNINSEQSLVINSILYKQYETLVYLTEITIEHVETMRNINEELKIVYTLFL